MTTEKVIEFKRESLTEIQKELEEAATAYGVVAIIFQKDGHACFRVSGFDGPHDRFIICGLLEWIKEDVLSDIVG